MKQPFHRQDDCNAYEECGNCSYCDGEHVHNQMTNIWKLENPYLLCVANFFGCANCTAHSRIQKMRSIALPSKENPAVTILLTHSATKALRTYVKRLKRKLNVYKVVKSSFAPYSGHFYNTAATTPPKAISFRTKNIIIYDARKHSTK